MGDTNTPTLRKHLLNNIFFLLCLQSLFCQEAKHFSFTHYGTNTGLLANEVTDILQDKSGYIWMATTNGLQRFDGSRYKTFRHQRNDSTSIPHNYVLQLLIDDKQNLWILTGDGKMGIFDTRNFRFHEVAIDVKDSNQLRYERRLIKDEQGHLFLLFNLHELLTYNEQTNSFSAKDNFIPVPEDRKINDLAQQPGTSKYWISTSTGFYIYNKETGKLSYDGHNAEKEPFIDRYDKKVMGGHLFFDSKGRLWYDSWEGFPTIYAFDIKKKEFMLSKFNLNSIMNAYHEVRGFMETDNGTIWIRGLGVFARYLETEKKFQNVYNSYQNEQSISYERVNTLYEDKEHNIWVATNDNGLFRFNPEEEYFQNIRQVNRVSLLPGSGSALSFMPTNYGTLLMGAWGDGLYQYDKSFNTIPLNIHGFKEVGSPSMWDMAASGDSNTIWMGAQPGIYAFDQASRSMKSYNPPILENRTIRQVAEDRYGNLWIGTQSIGALKWKKARDKNRSIDSIVPFKPIPPPAQVLKILVDKKGMVWIGTSAFGLYVIDPTDDRVVMHFNNKAAPPQKTETNGVASILEYDDTTMIFATNHIYIYNTKRNTLSGIGFPESITGNIAALERDAQGYIWISLSNGILRLNPRNNIFIHFDRVDGMLNDRFTLGASRVLKDGKILFGASNQFVVFDPNQVKINHSTPNIAITDFKVMNRSLMVDSLLKLKKIELAAKDNSLIIEFSGLNYINTYLIRYKLENLDKDWKVADKSNQAVYSYLPPGNYTFLVRSEDADGNPGPTVTKLHIKINPPFWRSWWFYSMLVLLGVFILYLIDQERVKRLHDLQRVRTEIANNLHKDVTTTLNNINLLGEMAKIKADKDINRSKEYIDQISSKSHNMIIAMDDILWSIDPENDSMEKTLLRMMEFTDALKNRHDAVIELALDKKVRSLKLGMRTRNEFFLIFKESLRMIVQYAGGKDTCINIDFFRNKLSLKLQDATAKLDSNIEDIERMIREINTRAAAIGAEADIQYDKNGIAIILLIPVR